MWRAAAPAEVIHTTRGVGVGAMMPDEEKAGQFMELPSCSHELKSLKDKLSMLS